MVQNSLQPTLAFEHSLATSVWISQMKKSFKNRFLQLENCSPYAGWLKIWLFGNNYEYQTISLFMMTFDT